MNTKAKVHWFYDDVYKMNYYLLVPAKENDMRSFIKKQWGFDYKGGAIGDGCCLEIVDSHSVLKGIVLGLRDFKLTPRWISALSHECLHATNYMFSLCRIVWDNNVGSHNNEPYNYYLEYLVRQFLELIKKDRKTVRKKASKLKKRSKSAKWV